MDFLEFLLTKKTKKKKTERHLNGYLISRWTLYRLHKIVFLIEVSEGFSCFLTSNHSNFFKQMYDLEEITFAFLVGGNTFFNTWY